ncbi:hypothetical protein Pelo_4533 [Pelomyxa schiedti]|nr:hypothetical protein Pelo_4533 [Pelomyxa schiedti]
MQHDVGCVRRGGGGGAPGRRHVGAPQSRTGESAAARPLHRYQQQAIMGGGEVMVRGPPEPLEIPDTALRVIGATLIDVSTKEFFESLEGSVEIWEVGCLKQHMHVYIVFDTPQSALSLVNKQFSLGTQEFFLVQPKAEWEYHKGTGKLPHAREELDNPLCRRIFGLHKNTKKEDIEKHFEAMQWIAPVNHHFYICFMSQSDVIKASETLWNNGHLIWTVVPSAEYKLTSNTCTIYSNEHYRFHEPTQKRNHLSLAPVFSSYPNFYIFEKEANEFESWCIKHNPINLSLSNTEYALRKDQFLNLEVMSSKLVNKRERSRAALAILKKIKPLWQGIDECFTNTTTNQEVKAKEKELEIWVDVQVKDTDVVNSVANLKEANASLAVAKASASKQIILGEVYKMIAQLRLREANEAAMGLRFGGRDSIPVQEMAALDQTIERISNTAAAKIESHIVKKISSLESGIKLLQSQLHNANTIVRGFYVHIMKWIEAQATILSSYSCSFSSLGDVQTGMAEFNSLVVGLRAEMIVQLSSLFVGNSKIQHELLGDGTIQGTSASVFSSIRTFCSALVTKRLELQHQITVSRKDVDTVQAVQHKDFLTDIEQINLLLESMTSAIQSLANRTKNVGNLASSIMDIAAAVDAHHGKYLRVLELYENMKKASVPEECTRKHGELCERWGLCHKELEKYQLLQSHHQPHQRAQKSVGIPSPTTTTNTHPEPPVATATSTTTETESRKTHKHHHRKPVEVAPTSTSTTANTHRHSESHSHSHSHHPTTAKTTQAAAHNTHMDTNTNKQVHGSG